MSDSQHAKIIRMLRASKRKGVANYQFPEARILNYKARVHELRRDGWIIDIQRQYLPNGRATNVFWYHLIEEEDKPSLIDRFKKAVRV